MIAEKKSKSERLKIFSATSIDLEKGHFYVEAKKESHVRTAIANLPFVRPQKLKLLSRNEMVNLFKMPKQHIPKIGDWVRFKHGIYRNDLAQVYSLSQTSVDRIVVRMIPRIGRDRLLKDETKMHGVQEERSNKSAKSDESSTTSEQILLKKRLRNNKIRPAAKFFNPSEVFDKASVHGTEEEQIWNGNRFKNGFLIKEVKLNALETEGIIPTLEEINKFKLNVKNDGSDEVGIKEIHSSKQTKFSKGDVVQVTRGELISLIGTVKSVKNKNVEIQVEEKEEEDKSEQNPDEQNNERKKDKKLKILIKIFTVPDDYLRKYFSIGSQVKVISGMHMNETGVVTSVVEDTVSIYSHIVHREIKALMSDLQISYTNETGISRLGNYDLFDLVEVGSIVGVIVQIEKEGFMILDQNAQTNYVPIKQVGIRKNSKNASMHDAQNNVVFLGEAIKILEGPYKDLIGNIKHIYRSTCFVSCPSGVQENRGIVCVKRNHILSLTHLTDESAPSATSTQMQAPRSSFRNSVEPEFINKVVVITSGEWKGYRAKVKEGRGQGDYRVQLMSKARLVKIPRSHLKVVDDVQYLPTTSSPLPSNSFNDGSQTPMRIQTPHHHTNYDSSGAWNPSIVPTTPSRNDSYIENEFNPSYKPPLFTPSTVPYTPGLTPTNVPFTPLNIPSTPSFNLSDSRSKPLTPGIPFTPGPPTTPTIPTTPQIPSTPHILSTPRIPSTPGFPSTPSLSISSSNIPFTPNNPNLNLPSTPGSSLSNLESSQYTQSHTDPKFWCQRGFEVFDHSTPSKTRYVIISPNLDNPNCLVELLNPEGQRIPPPISIPRSSLKLVVPQKKETVVCISSNKIGTLIGIDEQDGGSGIVRYKDDGEIQVLSMSSFAKLHIL